MCATELAGCMDAMAENETRHRQRGKRAKRGVIARARAAKKLMVSSMAGHA